ncbi:hydrogenase formation protein HypD [Thiorhodospira sibirica]|uniref:hydrogenase formation protein HypD n=1 Tax=Thiorhodospira sibirica TaxID=154347 RepID=UPI00022C406C|nr:hydrogenase formation protein HypD [Thiorhodospira sibirica]
MHLQAKDYLQRIQQFSVPQRVRILNVCGGHERSITHAGLRSLLPKAIELVPGPGCPVCVCPEVDIRLALALALHEGVLLAAFGDMLRVPINAESGEIRSLAQAKAQGAAIVPLASPQEAVALARQHPHRQVVFFAAGFETTMAPVAAMLAEGVPDNLAVLLSGRLTWPAVARLLDTQASAFDALIAPGHVATVMGAREWNFVSEQYQIACAVAGFTPDSLLAAVYSVLRQRLSQPPRCFVDNCYARAVSESGNLQAQRCLDQVFEVIDSQWRGIGVLPASGFALRPAYQAHDARLIFATQQRAIAQAAPQDMPPGCACAEVLLGQRYPDQCPLYGRRCTPHTPVGPCMVSDEGACQIWWASGQHAA